jgi:hypothetical protein
MSPAERDRRGRLLYIALGFLGLDVAPAEMPLGLRALHGAAPVSWTPGLWGTALGR